MAPTSVNSKLKSAFISFYVSPVTFSIGKSYKLCYVINNTVFTANRVSSAYTSLSFTVKRNIFESPAIYPTKVIRGEGPVFVTAKLSANYSQLPKRYNFYFASCTRCFQTNPGTSICSKPSHTINVTIQTISNRQYQGIFFVPQTHFNQYILCASTELSTESSAIVVHALPSTLLQIGNNTQAYTITPKHIRQSVVFTIRIPHQNSIKIAPLVKIIDSGNICGLSDDVTGISSATPVIVKPSVIELSKVIVLDSPRSTKKLKVCLSINVMYHSRIWIPLLHNTGTESKPALENDLLLNPKLPSSYSIVTNISIGLPFHIDFREPLLNSTKDQVILVPDSRKCFSSFVCDRSTTRYRCQSVTHISGSNGVRCRIILNILNVIEPMTVCVCYKLANDSNFITVGKPLIISPSPFSITFSNTPIYSLMATILTIGGRNLRITDSVKLVNGSCSNNSTKGTVTKYIWSNTTHQTI